MKEKVLVFGAGGHAKGIIEILKESKTYEIYGVIDKKFDKNNSKFCDIEIIGEDSCAEDFYKKGITKAFIAVGMVSNYTVRLKLYNKLKKIGFNFINVVNAKSILSRYCKYGNGNAFLAGCIVNSYVNIGDNCIINTGSILEHECIIGNNVHISTGAKLCGGVQVADNSMIGAGAVVIQQIRIGKNVIVGAGSVVINDIPDNSVVVGVPAKVIKRTK